MNASKALIFNAAIALTLTCGGAAALAQQSSQSDQPSLADVARKARAEKKEAPKSAKVFTNDDVSNLKGTINVVGGEPASSEATTNTAAAPNATAATGKGEAYFRDKFAAARRTLADDSKELDVLQREFNLKQTQFYSDPNVALREQYSRSDLNETQANIEAKRADVAKDQQAISNLEDELRKAGGEPGWENAPTGNVSASNSSSEDAPVATPPTNSAPQTSAPENAPQQGASQQNGPQ